MGRRELEVGIVEVDLRALMDVILKGLHVFFSWFLVLCTSMHLCIMRMAYLYGQHGGRFLRTVYEIYHSTSSASLPCEKTFCRHVATPPFTCLCMQPRSPCTLLAECHRANMQTIFAHMAEYPNQTDRLGTMGIKHYKHKVQLRCFAFLFNRINHVKLLTHDTFLKF